MLTRSCLVICLLFCFLECADSHRYFPYPPPPDLDLSPLPTSPPPSSPYPLLPSPTPSFSFLSPPSVSPTSPPPSFTKRWPVIIVGLVLAMIAGVSAPSLFCFIKHRAVGITSHSTLLERIHKVSEGGYGNRDAEVMKLVSELQRLRLNRRQKESIPGICVSLIRAGTPLTPIRLVRFLEEMRLLEHQEIDRRIYSNALCNILRDQEFIVGRNAYSGGWFLGRLYSKGTLSIEAFSYLHLSRVALAREPQQVQFLVGVFQGVNNVHHSEAEMRDAFVNFFEGDYISNYSLWREFKDKICENPLVLLLMKSVINGLFEIASMRR